MDFSEDNMICRLCLKKLTENYEPIEEIIQHALNFLTLCPNLTISDDPMICETCAVNLKTCFDFKTRCLSTEDCISSFGEGEEKKVDIRDIYSKVKLDGDIDRIPYYHSVCHFCLELMKDNTSTSVRNDLTDVDLIEMLQKYFLEMDLKLRDGIVACTSCYNSLRFHVKFIKDYVSIEEKIDEYCKVEGVNNKGQVDLRDVAIFSSKSMVNHENINSLIIKEDKERNIYTYVDIKVKLEDPTDVKQEKEQLTDEKIELKNNDSFQHSPPSQLDCVPQLTKAAPVTRPNCRISPLKVNTEAYFKKNILKHKHRNTRDVLTPGVVYECDLCDYKTKWKSDLTRHMQCHRIDSDIVFKCNLCDYETKRKFDLKGHILTHKTHSENTMYQCNQCEYQGKWMFNVQRHMLIHKTPSEVTMHKCELCGYQAIRKANLKRHTLIHKAHSEVAAYKCDLCDYETKRKSLLQRHVVIHKNAIYKCNLCDYESKQKWNLMRHMLTHKNSSETAMYKCEVCAYKTKHKYNLHKHKLKHKDVSEVKMHRCKVCSFKTKWKSSFQRHVLSH